MGDFFESGAVDVYHEEIELAAFGVAVVGAEDDLLAVGVEERGEGGRFEARHLLLVLAIGIHDPDFELGWADHVLFEQSDVVGALLFALDEVASPDDFLSVPADEGAAVVALLVGEASDLFRHEVGAVDLEVAVLVAGEGHVATIGVDGGFGDVAVDVEDGFENVGLEISAVEGELGIDHPDVAFAAVELLLRSFVGGECAAEVDVFVVGRDVAAGASALSGRDEPLCASVGVHLEDLLIGEAGLERLVGDGAAVFAEISFGILAPEGELADVGEVGFAGVAFHGPRVGPLGHVGVLLLFGGFEVGQEGVVGAGCVAESDKGGDERQNHSFSKPKRQIRRLTNLPFEGRL